MNRKGGGRQSHTPGRGHRRKSDPQKTKRFQREGTRKKAEARQIYDVAVKRWEAMTQEQRKLLPELHPDNFRQ
jgi:hypothetical protein